MIAILIFGIVVLAHEWGHFFAARRCGIFVEEFAIGMGPKLLATKGGENKTVYSLRLVPIGGFCKLLGEDADDPDPRALNSKKLSYRMLVMSAGSIMNFVLAFIIFFGMILFTGYPSAAIREVVSGSPAAAAGLLPGDRITRIGGTAINLYEDILFELSSSDGKPMEVRYVRDKQAQSVVITPMADANGDYKIGFRPDSRSGLFSAREDGYAQAGIWDSIGVAFHRIIFYIKSTVVTLVRIITRRAPPTVAGPIGVVGMIEETYQATIVQSPWYTLQSMLSLCALLAANLGVMNLLPLPALDGGRLAFLIFEGIRRKPVAPEREGMVHFVGFVMLMILAVFIAYRDIVNWP